MGNCWLGPGIKRNTFQIVPHTGIIIVVFTNTCLGRWDQAGDKGQAPLSNMVHSRGMCHLRPSATKPLTWWQSDKRVSRSAKVRMGLRNNPGPHFPGMPPCFTTALVACGSVHHQSQQFALACWFSYCLFCETAWQHHFCAFKKDTHGATTHIFSYGFSTTKYYF